MSSTEIEKSTSEQDALIATNRDKWRAIILSTEPIDRQKAKEAVKAAYECISQKEPEIIFCQSPYIALKAIFTELKEHLGNPLGENISDEIDRGHLYMLAKFGRQHIWGEGDLIYWQIIQQIQIELNTRFHHSRHELNPYDIDAIRPESYVSGVNWFDLDISVDEEALWPKESTVGLSLLKHCGWIFPFENICLLCDRPRKLSLDEQQRLHAEGEPALRFADGYNFYAYHGVDLPKKYSKLHPNQWQAQWLLEETNTELRRVLIQGIGYERICQELKPVVVDTWSEYTLLKIEIYDELKLSDDVELEIDYESGPMSLLKMTCPSTGFIHVLRVPPDMQSAREAICWVNWGIDPESFSMQT